LCGERTNDCRIRHDHFLFVSYKLYHILSLKKCQAIFYRLTLLFFCI
jgi:hypothetical protein